MTTPSWPLTPPAQYPPLTPDEVGARLHSAELWPALALAPEDREQAAAWATRLGPDDLAAIAEATGPVLALRGRRLGPEPTTFFDFLPDRPGEPAGLLPMLTLAVCSPEVVEFGLQQGFDAAAAASGLADLGHQVHVHRLATGGFGLFTQWWLTLPWGGSMWAFGRLQYNLIEFRGRYWLSVHIPQTGPLTNVQESFRAARAFAGTFLTDFDIAGLHLDSWLLDPALAAGLGAGSNTAAFARLWQVPPGARVADSEAVLLTFGHRGEVDPATLPSPWKRAGPGTPPPA